MLIEFTVQNFASIYERKTLSMQAQGLAEGPESNVAKVGRFKLLKMAAIYGANSSGKTNLLAAMDAMRYLVINSVRVNDKEPLYANPFILIEGAKDEPTLFEVLFLIKDECFRYGFEYNKERILSEWLFMQKTRSETSYFVRDNDGIAVNEKIFPEGKDLESRVNDNRLFLSLCAQLGGEISKKIINWFTEECKVISGLENDNYREYSKSVFLEKTKESKEALKFFKRLQLGFDDIFVKKVQNAAKGDESESLVVFSKHNVYNKAGKTIKAVNLNFDFRESEGTRKMFDLSGPIFNTLLLGTTIVIDELDAKMHPILAQEIVRLFSNPETNPNNAQLIFSTHDTHLLSIHLLRRDQIWFTEKDDCEQTDLYRLMDIVLPDGSKPRNDTNYEKNYIEGRYGAIPYFVND